MPKVKLLQNIVFIFHKINIAIQLNNIHMNMIRILTAFIVSKGLSRPKYKFVTQMIFGILTESQIPHSKLWGMIRLLFGKSAPWGGVFGLHSASILANRTSTGCSATRAQFPSASKLAFDSLLMRE